MESQLQTKVENIELRRSSWRFIRYMSIRLFFRGKEAKIVKNVGKTTKEKSSNSESQNKDKTWYI